MRKFLLASAMVIGLISQAHAVEKYVFLSCTPVALPQDTPDRNPVNHINIELIYNTVWHKGDDNFMLSVGHIHFNGTMSDRFKQYTNIELHQEQPNLWEWAGKLRNNLDTIMIGTLGLDKDGFHYMENLFNRNRPVTEYETVTKAEDCKVIENHDVD